MDNLRHYFAAHAPACPDWFGEAKVMPKVSHTPVPPEIREAMDEWKKWDTDATLPEWMRDQGYGPNLVAKAIEYLAARDRARDAHTAEVKAEGIRRLARWAWAYADAMLATV